MNKGTKTTQSRKCKNIREQMKLQLFQACLTYVSLSTDNENLRKTEAFYKPQYLYSYV